MALLRNAPDIFFRLQGDHGVAAILTFKDGTTVEMDWPSFGEEPRYSGTSIWANNQALRSLLRDFAYHTTISRTAYSNLHYLKNDLIEAALSEADGDAKAMKTLRATADAAQDALVDFARVLQYSANERGEHRHAWCSACLKHSAHLKLDVPRLWEPAFYCLSCGMLTSQCATPGCEHAAVRGTAPRGGPRLCALHAGEIADFEVIDHGLRDLSYWKTLPQFSGQDSTLLPKSKSIFALADAAPGLAGLTASHNGVALLESGAEDACGLGIAGGKVVATTVGAQADGAVGQRVATAYLRKDRSFDIEKKRAGPGIPVIYASGVTAGGNDEQAWQQLIATQYPDSPVYRLRWAAQPLKRISKELDKRNGLAAIQKSQNRLAQRAIRQAGRLLGPTAPVEWVPGATSTEWHEAQTWAVQAGWTLANVLTSTHFEHGFVLVGHSFGAAVMAEAALALSTVDTGQQPTAVHLLAAVLPAQSEQALLAGAVKGKVFNYFSLSDDILRHLYPIANFGAQPAGLVGFKGSDAAVEQVDCSSVVSDHHGYFGAIELQRGD